MKKRSLFAAVAMLIVSALVLTSATYAWFNVGGDAYVQATRGSVMQAGTGVRLKTDKPQFDWNSTLLPQDFKYNNSASRFVQDWSAAPDGSGGYTYTQATYASQAAADEAFYAPMSTVPAMDPASLAFSMWELQGDNSFALSNRNATESNYRDYYEFHVGTTISDPNGSDLDAIFTLGSDTWDNISASALAAARAMVFVSYDNGTTYTAVTGADIRNLPSGKSTANNVPIVFTGANENAYYATKPALETSTTKIVDDGGNSGTNGAAVHNYIMNGETSSGAGDGDTGYAANATAGFTEVPANTLVNATGGVQIKLTGVGDTNNANCMIKVIVWIEGQDANCAPALGGAHLTTSWQVTYKNPTA